MIKAFMHSRSTTRPIRIPQIKRCFLERKQLRAAKRAPHRLDFGTVVGLKRSLEALGVCDGGKEVDLARLCSLCESLRRVGFFARPDVPLVFGRLSLLEINCLTVRCGGIGLAGLDLFCTCLEVMEHSYSWLGSGLYVWSQHA